MRLLTDVEEVTIEREVIRQIIQVEPSLFNGTLNETELIFQVAFLYNIPLAAVSLSRLETDDSARRHLAARLHVIVYIDPNIAVGSSEGTNVTEVLQRLQSLWNLYQSDLNVSFGYSLESSGAEMVTTEETITYLSQRLAVTSCPPGFWGADGRCIACAPGTFGYGTDISECTPCP